MSAAKNSVHPLVGPAPCPICGRPIKRRRYWALWANVHCPCGVRMECVRQKPLTFTICRPNSVITSTGNSINSVRSGRRVSSGLACQR
jgi:hypothetical protein